MQKNSPDIENWLKLIRSDGVGPTAFARLLKYFRSVDRALGASVSELTKVKGIGPKTAEAVSQKGIRPDLVPDEYRAEAVVSCLKEWDVKYNKSKEK